MPFFITIFHDISHEITSDNLHGKTMVFPWFSHGFPTVFPWSCSFWYAKSAAALRLFADAPETLSDAASGPRARAKESSWHRGKWTRWGIKNNGLLQGFYMCCFLGWCNIYIYNIFYYIILCTLNYIVLYYIILHYIILHYIILYYITWCYIKLYCIILHYIILYYIKLNIILYI